MTPDEVTPQSLARILLFVERSLKRLEGSSAGTLKILGDLTDALRGYSVAVPPAAAVPSDRLIRYLTRLVFVDCEAMGGCPATGRLTEFGAVCFNDPSNTFHAVIERSRPSDENPAIPASIESLSDEQYRARSSGVFHNFDFWLRAAVKGGHPVFVSDNPAYDWQWINHGFHSHLGWNPFGHSARRIGDFYAGLINSFEDATTWKKLRKTAHDHNPVHDAQGNVEALQRLLKGER